MALVRGALHCAARCYLALEGSRSVLFNFIRQTTNDALAEFVSRRFFVFILQRILSRLRVAEDVGSSYVAYLRCSSDSCRPCWVGVLFGEEDVFVCSVFEDSFCLNTRADNGWASGLGTVLLIMVSRYVSTRWSWMWRLVWHVPIRVLVRREVGRSVLVCCREGRLTTLLVVVHWVQDMMSSVATTWRDASEGRWI